MAARMLPATLVTTNSWNKFCDWLMSPAFQGSVQVTAGTTPWSPASKPSRARDKHMKICTLFNYQDTVIMVFSFHAMQCSNACLRCRAAGDGFVGRHSTPDLRKLMLGFSLLRCWHGHGLPEWTHRQPAEGHGAHSWGLDSRECVCRLHGNVHDLALMLHQMMTIPCSEWPLLYGMPIAQSYQEGIVCIATGSFAP